MRARRGHLGGGRGHRHVRGGDGDVDTLLQLRAEVLRQLPFLTRFLPGASEHKAKEWIRAENSWPGIKHVQMFTQYSNTVIKGFACIEWGFVHTEPERVYIWFRLGLESAPFFHR